MTEAYEHPEILEKETGTDFKAMVDELSNEGYKIANCSKGITKLSYFQSNIEEYFQIYTSGLNADPDNKNKEWKPCREVLFPDIKEGKAGDEEFWEECYKLSSSWDHS